MSAQEGSAQHDRDRDEDLQASGRTEDSLGPNRLADLRERATEAVEFAHRARRYTSEGQSRAAAVQRRLQRLIEYEQRSRAAAPQRRDPAERSDAARRGQAS
jgi:hypothetical protein